MLFENTKTAFSIKKNSDLLKSKFIYKILSSSIISKIGTGIIKLAIKIKLPIKRLVKATLFNHFCAGENYEESSVTVRDLGEKKIFSVLDYSVEAGYKEESFERFLSKKIATIEFSKKSKYMPFVVFKPSCFGRSSLFEKLSKGGSLSDLEKNEWNRVKKRFEEAISYAINSKVKIMVDAEESWNQKIIDRLMESLMSKYNREEIWVFNTLQMYRKDRLNYLSKLIKKSNKENFKLGIKLVRGAYLEAENLRAKKMNYKSPICKSKEETDKNFDTAVNLILKNLDKILLFVGTHNESSIYKLMDWMQLNKISTNHPNIWFAQLYGMGDHITFNLASEKFRAVKYIPFGPIKEVLPYLIRRAEENSSVDSNSKRELELINKELKRRKVS
ncbi:MAG: proline dehydrogenase family protein [Bacteroidota bacterium]|nr:proline dehydrogenase family protein [Bacteroidota bacterium]